MTHTICSKFPNKRHSKSVKFGNSDQKSTNTLRRLLEYLQRGFSNLLLLDCWVIKTGVNVIINTSFNVISRRVGI